MSKEEITLTKGELERILAQAMGYAWNEAGRYKESLKYPMEAWDNKEKERLKIVDYYFNIKMSKDAPKISFDDFMLLTEQKSNELRKGQHIMNTLHSVWPEEYKRLSSVHYYDRTDIDCFYNDSLIPNTLEHLEEIWKF